ncbi:DUF4303 domain-containing protein [Clostridium sp. SHJSY1]|uniref:DUF4303 domain-containing protein n=1 Tax=Clostridium sp. SHJSY1 TaxID=2942483 RepID=UPI002875FFE3|nr:DUF4303 domain-containing protein [Clostridium sp. SHJSY1]MDS0527571.1 DUF4303 domain-containing protein [Clostridium sp. SHJSY1]
MEYSEWRLQLIEGVRSKYGEGYKIYYPDKTIEEADCILEKNIYIVDEDRLEEMLLEDCKKKIIEFSETKYNKDIYALVLEVDSDVGQIGISINSIAAYENRVANTYSNYSQDRLNGISGVKYNAGDFCYRFFDDLIYNSELKEILNAYYCIRAEHPILDVTKPIALKNNIFDNGLSLIGINILNRMQDVVNALDCTLNFIAFVSLGDMDNKTIVSLMKRTAPLSTLITIFGDEISS